KVRSLGVKQAFLLYKSIDESDLSTRVKNALRRRGITKIGELFMYKKSELLAMPLIGVTSLEHIEHELEKYGLYLSE
ncbi:MAG: DNA-directed RNA polymerase subunit alpha C-terminal domain-containing protein, partial [Candidatus Aenigmarchaeota archaeon]|nr:DNA-directed RNA polymerase subunit alpha C-terminal domain-containing protein [Candidatus Aenigmarchaeota archaeon]